MTVPDERLTEAVNAVVDPGLFRTLGDLGTVRSVRGRRRSTEVVVAVPAAGHPAPRELTDEIATAVLSAGGAGPEVELIAMNEAEEADAAGSVRARAGSQAGRRPARRRGPHTPGQPLFRQGLPHSGRSPSPPARAESASRP